eukprot:scaffold310_cov168-Amphora_coffeaeformis.AAC.40
MALKGQVDGMALARCALCTALTSVAYAKMAWEELQDWRALLLGEPKSVYQFSYLSYGYLSSLGLTVITLSGWAGAVRGKWLLAEVNDPASIYQGKLEPSSKEYQTQVQLYLMGNNVINSLACLFIPFAWTLTLTGTEWWVQVQELHPNQAAFLAVSILVAILGDTSVLECPKLSFIGSNKEQSAHNKIEYAYEGGME